MDRKFMYYSNVTKQPYETMEELAKAEDAVLAKEKEKEAMKAQRAARAKEVEDLIKAEHDAHQKAAKALEDFCKDYGSFHTSVKSNRGKVDPDSFFDLWFDHLIF